MIDMAECQHRPPERMSRPRKQVPPDGNGGGGCLTRRRNEIRPWSTDLRADIKTVRAPISNPEEGRDPPNPQSETQFPVGPIRSVRVTDEEDRGEEAVR